jgi:hypothetical protein
VLEVQVVPSLVVQEVLEVQVVPSLVVRGVLEVQVVPFPVVREVLEVQVVPFPVVREVLEGQGELVVPCQAVQAVVQVGAAVYFHHRSRHSFKILHPSAWDKDTTMFEAV